MAQYIVFFCLNSRLKNQDERILDNFIALLNNVARADLPRPFADIWHFPEDDNTSFFLGLDRGSLYRVDLSIPPEQSCEFIMKDVKQVSVDCWTSHCFDPNGK
jgi:hypothetical protein